MPDHGLNSASILEASPRRGAAAEKGLHWSTLPRNNPILSDKPKDNSGGLKSSFLILRKCSPLGLHLNAFPC